MPKRKKSVRPSLSTPKLNVGANYARDTTGVYALTPGVTISLPTFDRNQGNIAIEQASRQLLHEEYQARLNTVYGAADRLVSELRLTEPPCPPSVRTKIPFWMPRVIWSSPRRVAK
jgi:hypothetical protein